MAQRMNWLPWAAVAAGLALAVAQWFVWVYAPVEATMGPVQKIFYPHIAMALWCMISFLVVFLASGAYLWRRSPGADRLAGAAAEVGVLFAGLTLILGSTWGKASWGVWWTWDPRLTTTLIMWFVYCGYLVLRASNLGRERGPMVCAVVGVVAFLDVPLVFLSARMWRSIHPAVFKSRGGGLEPEMLAAMFACLLAFGLLWLVLVALRVRLARAEDRASALASARAQQRIQEGIHED